MNYSVLLLVLSIRHDDDIIYIFVSLNTPKHTFFEKENCNALCAIPCFFRNLIKYIIKSNDNRWWAIYVMLKNHCPSTNSTSDQNKCVLNNLLYYILFVSCFLQVLHSAVRPFYFLIFIRLSNVRSSFFSSPQRSRLTTLSCM